MAKLYVTNCFCKTIPSGFTRGFFVGDEFMIYLPFESREAFDRFVEELKKKSYSITIFPDCFKDAIPDDIEERLKGGRR